MMENNEQVRVCFYLDKEEERAFDAACIEAGTTTSDELRELVRDVLAGNLICLRPCDGALKRDAD